MRWIRVANVCKPARTKAVEAAKATRRLGRKRLVNDPAQDVAGPASGKKEDGLIFLLLLGFNKCLHKLEDKPWFRSFPAFLSFCAHFQQ